MLFIFCTKLTMLILTANIAFRPINQTLSIYSGYALIIMSLALPFTAIKTPVNLHVKPSILCLMLLLIVMAASYMAAPLVPDMDLLKTLLSFVATYLTIAIDSQTFTKRDLKDIFNIGKILSLVYVAYTMLPFSFRYTSVNEWGGMAFTLSMGNPNATAISVMFCILLLVGDASLSCQRGTRIVDYALAVMLMYTIYLLESRTVLVCSLVIVLFPFVHKMRIRMSYAYLAILIPIAAIGLQLWLAEQETITVLGKPLASGRDQLYSQYLEELSTNSMDYVLGIWGVHKLANYHNTPLAIIMNFGMIGLLLYYWFWSYEIKNMITGIGNSAMKKLVIIGVLVYFIHSSAEAAPMMGSVLYGTELVISCRLAKDQFT